MEYECGRCGSTFTELYKIEIHRQVHDRRSKIKEYGSPGFNDYGLCHGKQEMENLLCQQGPSIVSTMELFYGQIPENLKNELSTACEWN